MCINLGSHLVWSTFKYASPDSTETQTLRKIYAWQNSEIARVIDKQKILYIWSPSWYLYFLTLYTFQFRVLARGCWYMLFGISSAHLHSSASIESPAIDRPLLQGSANSCTYVSSWEVLGAQDGVVVLYHFHLASICLWVYAWQHNNLIGREGWHSPTALWSNSVNLFKFFPQNLLTHAGCENIWKLYISIPVFSMTLIRASIMIVFLVCT